MRVSSILQCLALFPLLAFPAQAANSSASPTSAKPAHADDQIVWQKKDCSDIGPREAGRVAYLEAKLRLTDKQRAAWATWRQARVEAAAKEQEACIEAAPKEDGRPTTPEREALIEKALTLKLQTLQSTRPALLALYEALTTEQKAIFDTSSAKHPRKPHDKK
jgi:hypothetical protein